MGTALIGELASYRHYLRRTLSEGQCNVTQSPNQLVNKIGQKVCLADATALRRGGSRSWLQNSPEGLADAMASRRGDSRSWLQNSPEGLADATALRRGDSRWQLQIVRGSGGCHGLVPWRLTFVATK
jgi:hypothetical protein